MAIEERDLEVFADFEQSDEAERRRQEIREAMERREALEAEKQLWAVGCTDYVQGRRNTAAALFWISTQTS